MKTEPVVAGSRSVLRMVDAKHLGNPMRMGRTDT